MIKLCNDKIEKVAKQTEGYSYVAWLQPLAAKTKNVGEHAKQGNPAEFFKFSPISLVALT